MARQRDYPRKKATKARSKYLGQAFQHIKKKVTYKVRKPRREYYSKKISENDSDIKGCVDNIETGYEQGRYSS